MTYGQALAYLGSFVNYEKISHYPYQESHKLERFKEFLPLIGDPQDSLRSLHVAGSKGKGSTCAFLAYILRESGYTVGLYTSPHLCDFRERIRVFLPGGGAPKEFDGMIPRASLARIVTSLAGTLDAYNKRSAWGPLTFFEVYTALAFLYFKERKTDFVVLETGLGGRLDATNVVSPLCSVITPLSLEHTDKLGTTLKRIAAEKAGIIKPHIPLVITAPQPPEAMSVIKRRACLCRTPLQIAGRKIPSFRLRLWGRHQLMNAAVAVAVVEGLGLAGAGAIRKGLYDTRWPGRCEVIDTEPAVLLDGAQNAASAAALAAAVREHVRFRKVILIIGVSSDKDIRGIAAVLAPLADAVIATRSDNPRALDPRCVGSHFGNKLVAHTENVGQALDTAFSFSGARDLIVITGSLFVVGEARLRLAARKERKK